MVGELRALLVARRSAVKARTQAFNQLHGLLVEADDPLASRSASSARPTSPAPWRSSTRPTGSSGRWPAWAGGGCYLTRRSPTSNSRSPRWSRHTHPSCCTLRGLVRSALRSYWSPPAPTRSGRLHSEAALAALCGACPVEASSGKTRRHRLNRGGDRAANTALWMIAHVRAGGPAARVHAAAARRRCMPCSVARRRPVAHGSSARVWSSRVSASGIMPPCSSNTSTVPAWRMKPVAMISATVAW